MKSNSQQFSDQISEKTADKSWVSVSTMMKGPDVQDEDKDLIHWIQEGEADKVEIILKNEPALVSQIFEDLLPIHWAADRGNEAIVKLLLKHGADIDAQDSDGQTALHYACSVGHENIIKMRLETKANVDITDNDGLKAIDVVDNSDIKAKYFL